LRNQRGTTGTRHCTSGKKGKKTGNLSQRDGGWGKSSSRKGGELGKGQGGFNYMGGLCLQTEKRGKKGKRKTEEVDPQKGGGGKKKRKGESLLSALHVQKEGDK